MTLKTFVFFDSTSTATESEVLGSLEGAEDMTLQVTGSGTIDLTIKCKSDYKNGEWSNVAAVGLGSLNVCNKITSAGIFSVPMRGMTSVKIVNAGSTGVNVCGRIMG